MWPNFLIPQYFDIEIIGQIDIGIVILSSILFFIYESIRKITNKEKDLKWQIISITLVLLPAIPAFLSLEYSSFISPAAISQYVYPIYNATASLGHNASILSTATSLPLILSQMAIALTLFAFYIVALGAYNSLRLKSARELISQTFGEDQKKARRIYDFINSSPDNRALLKYFSSLIDFSKRYGDVI